MDDLRIPSTHRGRPVAVYVNGRRAAAWEGETVHAALVAAGYTAFGQTKPQGEPLGAFCGMGICCGCLVTIDGKPDQRACMRLVEDGMEIGIHGA
jgi:sarcosine oxidase subunit alpha